jgi:hypothetical protein
MEKNLLTLNLKGSSHLDKEKAKEDDFMISNDDIALALQVLFFLNTLPFLFSPSQF